MHFFETIWFNCMRSRALLKPFITGTKLLGVS